MKFSICDILIALATKCIHNENLYSPHNSDSSSDKIDTKLYNIVYIDTKNKLN